MCGRFVLAVDGSAVQQAFNLDTTPDIQPRYNIAPTQQLPVITNEHPKQVAFYRWGLIPSWAKEMGIGNRLINARAETAAEKPAFRTAYKRRRCLIPTTGFYEWQQRDDADGKTHKVPLYIHPKDDSVFAFAGLWEVWHSPEGDEIRTFTILTTDANDFMAPIHNRMPVILDPADYDRWLTPDEVRTRDVQALLIPYQADTLTAHEVSKAVNRAANDSPECIVPVA
ncbi:MAG: SOS response-associated peptidase [Chloroflexi bacterium]|nr:SOS response-associated peptidase [Chloroflexota bacterium]